MTPSKTKIITIGGSAGSFDSLSFILPRLRPPYPWAVVVVLHLPREAKSLLPEAFVDKCALPVKEAEDKEPILPGTIYFAPPAYHLQVETNGEFSLSADEPIHFSRPSIDVLFESVALAYGDTAMGILMSGANEDGAFGLKKIAERGGFTMVENPKSARYAVMPDAALGIVKPDRVMSAAEMADWLPSLGEPRHG